jgi:hypothetical protein
MYVFQIKGLSGRFLAIELITKISGIIILVITLQYDMIAISVGILIQQFIHLMISAFYADKLLHKKPFSQFVFLLPLFIYSVLIALLNNYISGFFISEWMKFLTGIVFVLAAYSLYYFIFMKNEVKMLYGFFKNGKNK